MSTYTNIRVHFVWSTKNREPLIAQKFESELHAYLGGILRKRKHLLISAGGMEDHIHLLVGMHPQQSISDLARDMKANSSSWIHDHQEGPSGFAWQAGYGAFSVSQSSVPAVVRYIESQREHHKTLSFQEEFISMLKHHEISYDERYIWD